ncbi:hypothetical protein BDR03DRAFT_1019052 [Suillus americanus]|nr:hypothetical protein BDR03DRAFT_1019052 [Suillus americanus]
MSALCWWESASSVHDACILRTDTSPMDLHPSHTFTTACSTAPKATPTLTPCSSHDNTSALHLVLSMSSALEAIEAAPFNMPRHPCITFKRYPYTSSSSHSLILVSRILTEFPVEATISERLAFSPSPCRQAPAQWKPNAEVFERLGGEIFACHIFQALALQGNE